MIDGRAVKGVLFDVHDTLIIKDYRASPRAVLGCVKVIQAAGYGITLQDYQES